MLLKGCLLATMAPRTHRALVPWDCVEQNSSRTSDVPGCDAGEGEAERRQLGGLAKDELKGFVSSISWR